MVSAYLSARGRAGCAVAAFGGEQDPCGPGFAGSPGAAAQSRAGRVQLRGWQCWRYR
jgi:hypothetical protein